MVGKNMDSKTSHIFQQCYVKCCKLQNVNPINGVIPTHNGKTIDFCVDRIKYAEWAPILNALSCDLSLQSISIRCRQQVKTILEHVDCERLAKTVTKRAVILTNFMLSNLVEAVAQCLASNTLLTVLLLEGVPLRVPYINPLVDALQQNNSLQHVYLPRCYIGDAGCLAICNALRGLPNILTLDLSSCEITPQGAAYIADVLKYQKIHRYSENWKHTLRYRLPQLDTMSGLRRITLCGNMALGDRGAAVLMDVLADDLWIKALDLQWCDLTEASAVASCQLLSTNKSLAVLDLRHNDEIASESVAKIRQLLKENDKGFSKEYNWLSSTGSSGSSVDKKAHRTRSVVIEQPKDRFGRSKSNGRHMVRAMATKKEREQVDSLSEQLAEETSHRRQLEELNLQLVHQLRQLKQQHARLWTSEASSSGELHTTGSDRSVETSERSDPCSSRSGSSSITIDQNTLAYIQQAFQDIYTFIKTNQCNGECGKICEEHRETNATRPERTEANKVDISAKKAHSSHDKIMEHIKNVGKITKSACVIGGNKHEKQLELLQGMFEKQMGDTKEHGHAMSAFEEMMAIQVKRKINDVEYQNGNCSASTVSGSTDTLVHTPRGSDSSIPCINPHDALLSSSDED